MGIVSLDEDDLDKGKTPSGFERGILKPGESKFFDIEPGEIALCDYSKPPDISCRRVKTMGAVSDGYHTFDELYAHRIELFMSLCFQIYQNNDHADMMPVWKSLEHSDGTSIEGWFVMGIYTEKGKQITYHLPESLWKDCDFAQTLDQAPPFDGHTSADVLERLKKL